MYCLAALDVCLGAHGCASLADCQLPTPSTPCTPPQVHAPQLAADTGGLDLSDANQLLPRAHRSLQLLAYQHTALSSPATLLTVPLDSLLQRSGKGGNASGNLSASASLAVTTAGSADALCWWLEQQLTSDGGDKQHGAAMLSSSCAAGEAVLHPHIWQHLEYLNRQPLAAGQAVDVCCWLGGSGDGGSAADVSTNGLQGLSLDSAAAGSEAGSKAAAGLHFSVQLQGAGDGGSTAGQELLLPVAAEQAAVAAAVPQYHTSMLNDTARTVAYRDGIAAAMREAEAKAAAAAEAADQPQPAPPLVLEIGSGSGLLLLLARQAGASQIIGCERLPELQQVASQLLQANGAAHSVAVLPKHSRQLAVAEGGSSSDDGVGAAADLPRRAGVLLHEIFGTDPFSEGVWLVLPALKDRWAVMNMCCLVNLISWPARSAGHCAGHSSCRCATHNWTLPSSSLCCRCGAQPGARPAAPAVPQCCAGALQAASGRRRGHLVHPRSPAAPPSSCVWRSGAHRSSEPAGASKGGLPSWQGQQALLAD